MLTLGAGIGGYYWRAFEVGAVSLLSLRSNVDTLDSLIAWETCSEIDEAKAVLQASAEQIVLKLRASSTVGIIPQANSRSPAKTATRESFEKASRALENEMAAFGGTEHENSP